jgi:tetratricopeptide (TPR) repeat protein
VKDLNNRAEPADDRLALRGAWVYVAAGGLVLLAVLMTWGSYLRARADRLARAAAAAVESTDPARYETRVRIAAARAAVTPDDPEALHDLGLAHFEAAGHAARVTGAALAGGPAGFGGLPAVLPRGVAAEHVAVGLAACRSARAAGMLHTGAHVRLGQYAGFFAQSEPPIAHFERAKRLRSADAAVWFAVGAEAFRKKDYAAAKANWRRAMELSPAVIAAVLREAAAAPGAIPFEDLVPPDPSTVLAAADALYPDRLSQREQRRPILLKATAADPGGLKLPGLYALAAVFDELGEPDKAAGAWEAAVARSPDDPEPRDKFARWLELEERYDEALPYLEWLRERRPTDAVLRDRIDAARHGSRLKREIEGK